MEENQDAVSPVDRSRPRPWTLSWSLLIVALPAVYLLTLPAVSAMLLPASNDDLTPEPALYRYYSAPGNWVYSQSPVRNAMLPYYQWWTEKFRRKGMP